MQNIAQRLQQYTIVQYLIIVIGSAVLLLPSTSRAQGSFQINVTGIPPILSSPYIDALEQNYRAGMYTMQINFSAAGTAPVAFQFRIEGYYNGELIVEAESNPTSFTPGFHSFSDIFQRISFPFSFEELLNNRASDQFQNIVQSGTLPEGTYNLVVSAEPIGFETNVTTIPANVIFQVRYPQPPILLSPANGTVVTQEVPVFSWTPVLGAPAETFEYEVLLVEVLEGQTPQQAMEANREHLNTAVVGQTVLPYTQEFLPLERGTTYAWQLDASDFDGQIPLADEGESEIYTFTYLPGAMAGAGGLEDLAGLDRIPLVPDFAYLTNLEQLETEQAAGGLRLNGQATLALDFSGGEAEPVTVPVRANNLVIQGSGPGDISVNSGTVIGGDVNIPAEYAYGLDLIDITEIRWRLGEGVTASGDIILPNGEEVAANNRININRSGLSGRLVASGSQENPLIALGEDPVELLLTQASLNYPSAEFTGSGMLQLFGGTEACEVPVINLSTNSFSTDIACQINTALMPVEGSNLLQITLNNAFGHFYANLENDSTDYNLRLDSGVALQLRNGNFCGAKTSIHLNSQTGFEVESFNPVCTEPNPVIELGFADLRYSQLTLENLSYDPGSGDWNFALNLAGQLTFPAFEDYRTPLFTDITITDQGIEFPDINFTELAARSAQEFTLDGFTISLDALQMTAFTFPWFDWDQSGAGPWEFTMDMSLETPGSGSAVPYCFQGREFELDDIQFANGSFEGTAEGTVVENCRIELGAGYAVIIDEAAAMIEGSVTEDAADVNAALSLFGNLELSDPFACEPGETVSLGNTAIQMDGNGLLTGTIQNVIPDCPINIATFQASITQSNLIFEVVNGQQQARLDASADLQMEDGPNVQGDVIIDLMTGEIIEASFQLDEPFTWNIPAQDPVMSFRIEEAEITEDGFYIDGRNDLVLPDTTIRATFNNLVLNYRTMLPDSGTVIFDQAFAFEAGLDTTSMSLTYQAVSPSDTLSLSPGVFMKLAGQVMIDTLGLRLNGTALAQLNLGQWSLDSMEVDYEQGFALSLSPFEVHTGQANFSYQGQQMAFLDPSGFHPMSGLFKQVIPNRIPLPKETIAYLQLKQNNNLLVNASRLQGGSIQLDTKPNQSVPLVIPGLQGKQSQPPQVDVTFNNLTFNPRTFRYISGSMTAAVPANSPDFDLTRLGIPLVVEEVALETRTRGTDQVSGLFFDGQLQFFDESVGSSQSASFFFSDNEFFEGTIGIGGLDTQFPLVGQSDRVVLAVDSVSGSMNTPLPVTGAPVFDFDFDGGFQINDTGGNKAGRADLGFRISSQGFSVTAFDTTGMSGATEIQLGAFGLDIRQINNLTLSYSEQAGFDFFAGLDISLLMDLQTGDSLVLPMQNVEIRDDIGFYIPRQQINSQSKPKLQAPEFDVGIFRIDPIAFRMQGDTLNWYNFSPGDVVDFLPSVDLTIEMHGVRNKAPQLSQASLTAQNVGYQDGVLTGSIESYSFGQQKPDLPLGGSVSVYVDSISGGLRNNNGQQAFDINLNGHLSMPDMFSTGSDYCEETAIALAIQSDGGVVGSVTDFAACGAIERGPLRMTFPSSDLTFAYTNNTQSAMLSGAADAAIGRPNADSIQATGNLTLDLIDQEVTQGSLSITGPFTWYYPESDSLFNFTVNTASIDSSGLSFTGSGALNLEGGASSTVNYSDLTFDLTSGYITDGSVSIQNNFALDIGLSAGNWATSDTSTAIQYDPGVRFTMPSNLTIDRSGLQVNGQSSASLEYMDTSLVSLDLDFVNFLIGFRPDVDVNSGRADLLVSSGGATPTRVAWYDSAGFHPEDVLGAAPLPDTLGLPTKDIAYIVLRDQNGNAKVSSSNVSGGMSISTNSPLPLVLAALESPQGTPQANVSFQDLVINGSYEVTAGSIAVDIGGSPINLSPYGDYPFLLTGLHYKMVGNNYDFWASARFDLPQSLNNVPVSLDTLRFNKNGFQQAAFSAGNYTESHTENDTLDIAHHVFSDSALVFYVRGARASFGTTNQYSFSGDFTSNMLEDSTGAPTLVHYYADYTNGNWQFEMETSHLPNKEIPIGLAKLQFQNINITANNSVFATEIDGTLSMPELLSEDFSMTVNGLHIGTDGVRVNSASASGAVPQQFSLFSGVDTLTVTKLNLALTQNRDLMLTMDGDLLFLDRDISFTGLQLGTDGTFGLQSAQANLLTQSEQILGEYFTLDTLRIGVQNNVGQLTAKGTATIPDPIAASSGLGIVVDTDGNVQVTDPQFDLRNNPPTVNVGDDLASISLTGFSLDIDAKNPVNTALMADANLIIDGDNIQFGEPGSGNKWGMRYQYGKQLEYNITNSPTFKFEEEFFSIKISNVALSGQISQSFGVNIDGTVGLTIDDAISSTITMENFEITTDSTDIGNITGGSLDLKGFVSVTVGEINAGSGQLTIKTQSGTNSDPGATDTTIVTQSYFQFGGASIDVLNGTFSGGVKRILYYKTQNSVYLNVDSAAVGFNGVVTLEASMEYLKKPNGFKLMVAGGGSVGGSFPGGAIDIAAMGKISTLQNELALGVFVKAELSTGVPLFPGIAYIGGFGGGFFLNPEASDFNTVAGLVGYNPNAGERTPPWQKPQNQDLDFAVMIYGAVDIVGMGGAYAYSAEAYLVVTDNFISLDAKGFYLSQEGKLEGSMYLSVDWSQGVTIQGGGAVNILYSPVVEGGIRVDFQVVSRPNNPVVWAVTGGTTGDGIDIMSFVTAQADFVASPEGFYFSMGISKGFDVWLISIHANWDMELWWIYQEQLGAYTEIGFKAKLFGGAASIGGNLKGALIIEGANDYLVYAAASGHAKVIGVFNGTVHVWVALRNGNLNGGRGESKYSSYIDEARAQAKNMDEKMSNLTDKLSALENAPKGLSMSDETKAAAGLRFLMGSSQGRSYFANQMLNAEQNMTSNPPSVFSRIANQHIRSSRPFNTSDSDLESLRQSMNQKIQDVSDMADSVYARLSETRSSAIEWKEQAAQFNQNILNSPVTKQLEWNGNQPASFNVDSTQAASNSGQLSNLKENIDALDQLYQASIDSVSSNISKIDKALSGRITLPSDLTQRIQTLQYEPAGQLPSQQNGSGGININLQNSTSSGSGMLNSIGGTSGGFNTSGSSVQQFRNSQLGQTGTDLSQTGQQTGSAVTDLNGVITGGTTAGGAGGIFYEPSANGISQSYVDATESIDAYYAKYISKLWRISEWAASGKLNDIKAEGRNVSDALKTMINRIDYNLLGSGNNPAVEMIIQAGPQTVTFYQGGTYSPTWSDLSSSARLNVAGVFVNEFQSTRDATAKRVEVIFKADTAHAWSAARDSASSMRSKMNNWRSNNDYGSIILNYHQSGMALWFESLHLAYQDIISSYQQRALNLSQSYQTQMDSMRSAHGEFTRLVDELYDIKSNMTVNLYGMVEEYAEWREAVMSDSAAQVVREQRNELQSQLSTPTINNISLSHDLNDFATRMDLSWNATHQTGDIVESSVFLESGSRTSILTREMFSTGGYTEMTRYAFKDSKNDTKDTYRFVVRARGPAGTTISRVANFSVPVDEVTVPYGQPVDGLSESSSGQSVMEEDNTPPHMINVKMDYNKSGSFWTADSNEITFTAAALDDESGISEYQYSIGTTKGDTNVVGWTVGQGERVLEETSFSFKGWENAVQRITTHLVSMQQGTPYYLSVRAVNGAGDTSRVHKVDSAVRYDGTPPTAPEKSVRISGIQYTQQMRGSQTGPVYEQPDYLPPKELPLKPEPKHKPEISLDWDAATDSESGIYSYEYAVTTNSSPENAFSEGADTETSFSTETTITGEPLDFDDEFYVHIIARNHAGLTSPSAITYGPIQPADPTPPASPVIHANVDKGDLGFYLTRPSFEFETNFDTYEYSIGTSFYDHSVVPWTEISMSSGNQWSTGLWALTANQTENVSNWPSMPATRMNVPESGLSQGRELYIHVRGVNSQDQNSVDASSGPFVIDTTAPPEPTVQLNDITSGQTMSVTARNVGDPESEIIKVEFRVKSVASVISSSTVKGWTEISSYTSGGRAVYLGTADYSGYNYDNLQVQVRITNENGLQTTVTEGYQPTYQVQGSQQNQSEVDFSNQQTYQIGDFGGF